MEIEIIYEKGAFRPLKKEYLKEGTRLTFIIEKMEGTKKNLKRKWNVPQITF